MKKDPLLDDLADMLRDESRELAPYQRHLRGELDADGVRALEAAAATDAQAARVLALHRPLSEEEQERLIAAVQRRETNAPPSTGTPPASTVRSSSPPPPGKVSRLFKLQIIAPLAIAAALGLFVLRRDANVELPAYAMVAQGEAVTRGAEATGNEPVGVREGSSVEIVLRPAHAVTGAVTARLFLESAAGAKELSEVSAEASDSGAIRLRARVTDVREARALLALVGAPTDVAKGLPARGSARELRSPVRVLE